jgi:hypothetical protein
MAHCKPQTRNRKLLAVVVLTSLLGSCGEDGVISRFMLKPDRIIVERRPTPFYDELFPYYVELCARVNSAPS